MPECVNPNKAESQMTLASARSMSNEKQPGWWERRTRMERYLMLAATTVVFVVVTMAIALAAVVYGYRTGMIQNEEPLTATQTTRSTNDVCLTSGCTLAAAAVIKSMDESVHPCDDFFQFSCGGFLQNTPIPEEKSSISQFSQINDRLREKLRVVIESNITKSDSPATKMVKNLYKSCMDTDRIAKKGVEPLKEVLKEMGGWPVVEGSSWDPSAFEWNKNIYINRKLGYSIDYLFDFSVTVNIKNSTWRIIDVDQPPLGMPSRKYLLKGFNDSDVQAYYAYQVGVATLLGADKARAEKELRDSLEFEIKLANYSLPKEERRNATKLYNKMSISELQKLAPQIPWMEYIRTVMPEEIKITNEEPVVVNVPEYFKNLAKLLMRTPKRTISNYLLWRVTKSTVAFLSEDIRDLQFQYSKKLTGKAVRESRWKECMGAVSGSLSHAVGSLYARSFFKKNAKAAADEMVSYIRNEFDHILNNIDWMDDKTREKALNKSKAITPHIGYPPELLMDEKLTELYDGLVLSSDDLLTNMRNLTIFGTNYSFRRLREKIDKNDWKSHSAAATVNAFYSPIENSIQFPAGILQGTFFDAGRPKYLNFGAIGYVIGHEITHGFDDTGRQFDANGDLRDWWEHETESKFLKKAKCIIYQYGNYSVPEVGLNVNGINTQGENIADNGGIKEAYYGYQAWVQDHHLEGTLPGLNYNQNQLFWMSAANVWCGKYRPESLKLRLLSGVHSPAQFRVNGPFSNLKEFAQDWNCPLGTKMNPREKCRVW
ncbi:M13 family metallopeptidase neprilysin 2 isoform X2 [Oratosquilla oratoria]|uniref:M13 family metallopeptidase neprilysin 2 isoform X2 n=1 Tax=Oratosquilla oratoria TaxID=337810 RepID=UPI003F775186